MTHDPQVTSTPPPSWLARNVLWVALAVGGISLLTLVTCCGGFFWLFSMSLRSNPVVELALQRAQADSAVVARLGEPLQPGHLIFGTIQTTESTGDADLRVPLHGPRGGAEMFITAVKLDNQWQLTSLSVQFEDEQTRHVIIRQVDPPITMPPTNSGGDQ